MVGEVTTVTLRGAFNDGCNRLAASGVHWSAHRDERPEDEDRVPTRFDLRSLLELSREVLVLLGRVVDRLLSKLCGVSERDWVSGGSGEWPRRCAGLTLLSVDVLADDRRR